MGYKIEYPFSYIEKIYVENSQPRRRESSFLVVKLTQTPNCFMEFPDSDGFVPCEDFTEDQQASQVMMHRLGGHSMVLADQLTKLVSLESVINRHES
jgi:hypothetical protein